MMRKIAKIPICTAGLLAALLVLPGGRLWSQAAAATGTIRGTITGTAQQPVAGAQVGVVNTRGGARTNSAGVFVIAAVPAGTHTLRAQMIGYAVVSKPVTVVAGQTATVNFSCRRRRS